MKDVKARHTNLKANHNKTNEAIKGYNKRNTRCMTNSKNNEQKTSKKIRYSIQKKAHKRYLKKSTRVDEENKNRAIGKYFLCKLCLMFTDLTGTI